MRTVAVVVAAVIGFAGAVWVAEEAAGTPGDLGSMLAAGEGTIVVAHRGGASIGPENTLTSIGAAIDAGVDLIEVDVQLTADGVPVLMHDWTVDRTTDGTGAAWSMPVSEISALTVNGTEARVPTLRSALQAIAPSRVSAMLELKGSWTAGQIAVVAALVAEQALEHRVVLASFDLFTLRAARDAAPELPRLLLTRSLASIAVAVADVAASAVGISVALAESDPDTVATLADAGIGVFVYTVNSADRWAQVLEFGVRGMITDDPVSLAAWLDAGGYSRDTSAR